MVVAESTRPSAIRFGNSGDALGSFGVQENLVRFTDFQHINSTKTVICTTRFFQNYSQSLIWSTLRPLSNPNSVYRNGFVPYFVHTGINREMEMHDPSGYSYLLPFCHFAHLIPVSNGKSICASRA